jgi:hypothetical protein
MVKYCDVRFILNIRNIDLKIALETAWRTLSVVYEAAMPTEAWLPFHCFVATDCFRD